MDRRAAPATLRDLYVQQDPKQFAWAGWTLLSPEGRPPWVEASTALRCSDWWVFRDPSKTWQRPYVTLDGCYYSIEGHGKIEVDMAEVSERLGRDLSVSSFLVVMSSYYGRVRIEEQRFGIYADLLDLEDSRPA